MMKKTTTWVLTIFVFVIWSIIAYKLYVNFIADNFDDEIEHYINSGSQGISSYASHHKDSLKLHYPDPFLKINSLLNTQIRPKSTSSRSSSSSKSNLFNEYRSGNSAHHTPQNTITKSGASANNRRRENRNNVRSIYNKNDDNSINTAKNLFPSSLVFKGTVTNKSHDKTTGIIHINERDLMIKQGSIIAQKFLVKSITQDSLIIVLRDSAQLSETYYFKAK